jgi:DNA-binding CsgD family transcriptional regulator
MARLSESDYRKILEVVFAAGETDGPIAFPEPILRALRELIPCDVVSFHERSASSGRVLVYIGEPLGDMTPEIRAAHRRLRHEDPVQPADGARKLTDVVALREFRRRGLYLQVHRPLGVEYMLWLYLDPRRTDARLEFDRANCDFRERDRTVLDLLLPHLRQFLRAGSRRRTAPSRPCALTPREREVIAGVAEGRTNGEIGRLLGISRETVRKHLENAYEKLGVHTRTGAVAAAFGSAREGSRTPG